MYEKLSEMLVNDEKLLWYGRPEPFKTLDQTNKKHIITWLIVKCLIIIGLAAAYFITHTGIQKNDFLILILFAALGGFAVSYPFIIVKHLRNRKIYGLTDQRILRIGESKESVPYTRIKNAALRIDADGHTSLLCGEKTIKLRPYRWRAAADVAFSNRPEDPEAEDIVLYALHMDSNLESVLKEHLLIS